MLRLPAGTVTGRAAVTLAGGMAARPVIASRVPEEASRSRSPTGVIQAPGK